MQFSWLVLVICFLHELGIGNCLSSSENKGNSRDSNLEDGNLGDGNLEDGNVEDSNLEDRNAEDGNLEDGNPDDDNLVNRNFEDDNSEDGNLDNGNSKNDNVVSLEEQGADDQSGEGVQSVEQQKDEFNEGSNENIPNNLDDVNTKSSGEEKIPQTAKKEENLKAEIEAQYTAEKKRGSPADMFGTNQHYYYPTEYKDFSRKFVLQYPYKEKKPMKESVAEAALDKVVKDEKKKALRSAEAKLIPVKASPELVLSVAMQSVLDEANNPRPKHINHKEILRTGEYWNSVWKEEVDPERVLRTYKEKTSSKLGEKQFNRVAKLKSLRAKIMPGSKLFQLVSALKQYSPRLLYVINDQNKK